MRRNRIQIPVSMLALALVGVAAGCGGSDSLGDPNAAAITVDTVKVTNGEVERRATFLGTAPQESGQAAELPAPDSDAFWELRRQAAEQLRDQAVVGILAKRCGKPCTVTRANVDEQIKAIETEQFSGSAAALDKTLKDRGYTRPDLRKQIESGLAEEKLIERQQRGVAFTEAQAQAYYNKNKQAYTTPAEKRLSHILVATKAVATALRPQLTAANFADTAKARSLDQAAKTTGGDLGSVTGSGLIPEIAAAASTLKAGVISSPVESQFGWHLLLVTNVPARTKPFAEVKDSIVQEQLQTAQIAKVEKWRNDVVKKLADTAKFANSRIAPPPPATPTTTTTTTTATTATTTTTTATTATSGTTTTTP